MQQKHAQSRLSHRILTTIKHPFEMFIHAETSSGLLLMICGIIAFICTNSPLKEPYHHLWEMRFSIGLAMT
jgi:NhaA family Na+:H+ antiporter